MRRKCFLVGLAIVALVLLAGVLPALAAPNGRVSTLSGGARH